MVMTLLEASHKSGTLPPKLVLVHPARTSPTFSPETWFTGEVHISFLCAVTLEPGLDRQGRPVKFTIRQPRDFLLRLFPYVKFGLLVVQTALLSGRLLGYPVPEISQLYDGFTEAAVVAGAMADLVGALEQICQSDDEAQPSFDYTALLEGGRGFPKDEVETLRAHCEENFAI
eukprot:scaffold638_cov411-Pinguiococcus_pyrenoidosus.AAC.1